MRIGTIGTSSIVDEVIHSARLVEGIEFAAAYSRDLKRGQAFAKRAGIEHVYDDLETFLSDESIDTVYIASPNSLHYDQAIQSLNAGKHVIVEKPLAGNTECAKMMIETARENKCFLFEAICNIHMPHFSYIKEELPKIGRIRLVQCNYSQYSRRYDELLKGGMPNVFNPEFSGGALADINIYNLHFIVGLFGSPKEVHYSANLHENGVDLSGIAVLHYDDFLVEAVGAKDSFSRNFGQIQGEAGYLYIDSSVNELHSIKTVTKKLESVYNIQDKPRLYYEFAAFKQIIDNKDMERYQSLLDHSYRVVGVAEACRKEIGLYFNK